MNHLLYTVQPIPYDSDTNPLRLSLYRVRPDNSQHGSPINVSRPPRRSAGLSGLLLGILALLAAISAFAFLRLPQTSGPADTSPFSLLILWLGLLGAGYAVQSRGASSKCRGAANPGR